MTPSPLIRPSATFSPQAGRRVLDFVFRGDVRTFNRDPLAPRKRGEGGRRPGEGRGTQDPVCGVRTFNRVPLAALALLSLLALPLSAQTSSDAARLPGNVTIAQKLDTQIPLDLMFRDEQGKVVRLEQYFRKGRPVLLNFVYFRCPMLCPMVLEGTTTALTHLKFNLGEEFDLITVSIDPRDRPADAAARKHKFVKHYGRLSAASGWHFLTGNETTIKRLADSVGFQFAYDGPSDQFAHGAALMVLTPDGRMSRYFYGFEFKPRDIRLAIVEASEGKVGTTTDQLLLLCFHYDPTTGKYSRNAMMFARAGGVTTFFALSGFIIFMFRKERRMGESADADGRLQRAEGRDSAVSQTDESETDPS